MTIGLLSCRLADDGSFYFTASAPEYYHIVLRHSDTLRGLADAGSSD
ncbi:MAG: hypothetical protein J6E32_01245 [Lachnospiraceae bacterium]|nr:hypothetical protein [Lachnospiraceae bacterium]